MPEEDAAALPEGIAGLCVYALRLYARRWPLYAGLALLVFAAESLAELIAPGNQTVFTMTGIVALAFAMAAVSVGVLGDAVGAEITTRGILDRATARWWAVCFVNAIFNLLVGSSIGVILNFFSPDNGFGLFPLLCIALWASTGLATVTAAFDLRVRGWYLIVYAIGRGGAMAFTPRNVSRSLLLALATFIPAAIELVVVLRLLARNVPHAEYLASAPFDALFVGPLQALFAVFALDMAKRLAQPAA